MGKTQNEAGPIAILVVHGIGAQEPGESSRKLMAGLARVDRSLDPSRSDGVITVGGQPVRRTLTRFGDWGKVFNHRLLGGGFLRGHVVYEHSPVFLGVLTRGLCGHELPFARTREEQWRDRLVLAGETLFAPAAAALVLTCGMALFLLAALLLPFLASLILRQFLPEQTWVSIENRSALVFIGLMVLVFVLNPVIRASRVQRLYWIATPSVERK